MGQGDWEVGDLLERAHVLRRQSGYAEALPLIQQAAAVAPQRAAAKRSSGVSG